MLFFRGISSTVRRCIEKETGREFAAKIIDLATDSTESSMMNQMLEGTRQEIAMLRHVMGHPYISEYIYSVESRRVHALPPSADDLHWQILTYTHGVRQIDIETDRGEKVAIDVIADNAIRGPREAASQLKSGQVQYWLYQRNRT